VSDAAPASTADPRTAARADAGRRPLQVVILGDWLRFPHGMAATGRALLTARALQQAGAHVHVMSLQATEHLSGVENTQARGVFQGVPFEYTTGTTVRRDSFVARRLVAAWGWVHGALRLAQLRREGRLDVVCLWFWTPQPVARLALFVALLRLLGVPIVREVNEIPWSLNADATALERLWSPLAGMAGAVTISVELSDWAAGEARGRRPLRVIEVPILVDVDEQPPTEYPSGAPLVVFAGSPEFTMTIEFIFAAMDEVWRTHPECRLAISGAGAGYEASGWQHVESRRPGLAGRVDVLGFLDRAELLALYGRAHALLIPLFDDAGSKSRFPTKIGEYLAAARPVVTSAVGEIPRFFTDGVDALVCPPDDPVAFGRAIAGLLADPDRAALIGRRGRALAERRFHYGLYADTLARAFADVAERKAPQ
jgi:glycosyltransferase involved in cell wall biosynthesis